MPNLRDDGPVAVLGAGPAGLTAAHELARRERPTVLVEADGVVGGLARTVVRDGYRFDLGGHRFFTKAPEIENLWRELLGAELLERPRLSRIRWRGRFIDYPLQLGDVVRKVGPLELTRCASSYAAALIRPSRTADNFEQWVSSRFGRRLYELFFRSYTEKVWGVPATEIRAEWAAQRIRSLSLGRAVRAAALGDGGDVHSLIERFLYPRLGPGQMWETMATETIRLGGELRLGAPVTQITHDRRRISAVVAGEERLEPSAVISSLPLGDVARMFDPLPPREVLDAAAGLRYRDFLTVALVVEGNDPFPDNWIYVHDPQVAVGRIQNFRAWSPDMVPEPDRSCLGLEYFCFQGDELWSAPDERLIERAASELERTGLVARDRVVRGYVVRVPKAYPIYDAEYAGRLKTIRSWLDGFEGLQQIGRNGLHRYNNSDHSMLTALRAVDNVCLGTRHDIWSINTDDAYQEESRRAEQPYREAPLTPAMSAAERA